MVGFNGGYYTRRISRWRRDSKCSYQENEDKLQKLLQKSRTERREEEEEIKRDTYLRPAEHVRSQLDISSALPR